MKIAVTGANSSVGQNLLNSLKSNEEVSVIAGVRSERAAKSLPDSPRIEAKLISYQDVDKLSEDLNGADCVLHLAGILIENKGSSYQEANVDATAAVLDAAKRNNASHFVFISVVGADANSTNAYFRSKGQAEELVKRSGLSASIIRTPILLGPNTAGASAIAAAASQPKAKLLGGGTYLMRPLDIDDLNLAIMDCFNKSKAGAALYELVGPDAISYSNLIQKMAGLLGNEIEIASIPIWVAKLGAAIGSRLRGGGFSPTVIDVITIDEKVDENADKTLGLSLTPLDKTLQKILNHEQT